MKRTGGTALKDRFGSAVLELSPVPQHDNGLISLGGAKSAPASTTSSLEGT